MPMSSRSADDDVRIDQQRAGAHFVAAEVPGDRAGFEGSDDVHGIPGASQYLQGVGARGDVEHIGDVQRKAVIVQPRQVDLLDVLDLRARYRREVEVARGDLQRVGADAPVVGVGGGPYHDVVAVAPVELVS